MKEKLNEVKKALDMCYKQGLTSECKACPYREHNNVCVDALMEDALAVINYLEEKQATSKDRQATNADRIRAMSDEELAKFLSDKPLCPGITKYKSCPFNCSICWGEWLKQLAETENAGRCVCCGAIIPEGQMVCPNRLVTVKER